MVTVIGLGFVGLTTGLGFAHKGIKVYGVDISESKINKIKSGKIPFFEPGLEEVLAKEIGHNFIPTSDLKEAINNSEVVFFCVGTPSDDNGKADLNQIYQSIENTLKVVEKGKFKLLVIKSTIPPSTTSEKIKPFIENLGFKTGIDIGLANNPEFLREGYAWDDFIRPDRIVIGTEDEKSFTMLSDLYKHFESPLHNVSYNTGEYIKYLSNTLLATMISFANEQSMIAHSIGNIDIARAFKILHNDKRWYGSPAPMTSYVYPGCGFGGYCLPKDTQALIAKSAENNYHSAILESVINVNNQVKKFHVDRITSQINQSEPIGILGLSFKPNSDDVRDSPAYSIISDLFQRGYSNIYAYDPIANDEFDKAYKLPIKYLDSVKAVAEKSNHLIILTGWDEFKKEKQYYSDKKVFDLRYIIES
jgi:UDPglucose 6-dehydrogenase